MTQCPMLAEDTLFHGFHWLRLLGRPYSSAKPLSWYQILVTLVVAVTTSTVSLGLSLKDFLYEQETISTFVLFFIIIGNNLLGSSLLLLNLRSQHPLINILNDIENASVPKSSLKHFYWLLISFVSLSVNILLDFRIYSFPYVLYRLPFYIGDVLTFLFLVQFIVPLNLVKDRIKEICLILERFQKRQDFSLVSETLELIAIHRRLVKVCTKINSMYSWPLLVVVSCSLISSVGTLYYATCSFLDLLPPDPLLGINIPGCLEACAYTCAAITDLYKVWCVAHTSEISSVYVSSGFT